MHQLSAGAATVQQKENNHIHTISGLGLPLVTKQHTMQESGKNEGGRYMDTLRVVSV